MKETFKVLDIQKLCLILKKKIPTNLVLNKMLLEWKFQKRVPQPRFSFWLFKMLGNLGKTPTDNFTKDRLLLLANLLSLSAPINQLTKSSLQ